MNRGVGIERIAFDHERDELPRLERYIAKTLKMVVNRQKLTYEEGDVDMAIARKFFEHVQELEAIEDWIFQPNPNLSERLWSAKRKFDRLLKEWEGKDLYRGFSLGGLQGKWKQNTLGLSARPELGDRFTYLPESPLSFSHIRGVAEHFGDVVVKLDWRSNVDRILPLTPSLLEAVAMLYDGSGFYKEKRKWLEAETIVLPNKKPLELEIVQVGRKKK